MRSTTVLSHTALEHLDGVGEHYAVALAMVGITTIGELAETDLMALDFGIPPTKLVELQAKSVLALRSAASVPAVQALARHSASRLATSTTATGAFETAIAEARAQAAALQLALNDRFLERMNYLTGRGADK